MHALAFPEANELPYKLVVFIRSSFLLICLSHASQTHPQLLRMKDGWHRLHPFRHQIRMWNTGLTVSSIITAHPPPPLPPPLHRTQVGGANTVLTPPQTLPQLPLFWLTSWLTHNSVSTAAASVALYHFYITYI